MTYHTLIIVGRLGGDPDMRYTNNGQAVCTFSVGQVGRDLQYLPKDNRMTYHTLIIVGRLGGDPDMRYTNNGQAVCTFNVATDRKFTTAAGEKKSITTWFSVTAWGKLAETCNTFLRKGKQVLVEGGLRADKSTGGPIVFERKDGTSGAKFEMTAENVRFLGGEGKPADESDEIGF